MLGRDSNMKHTETYDTYAEAVVRRDELTKEHGGFWAAGECSTGTYGEDDYRVFYVVERHDLGFETAA